MLSPGGIVRNIQSRLKHDVDGNGVLDRTEFRKCLSETELGLERRDIQALMAAADANEDGGVDYAEFIALSQKVLLHLAREKVHRFFYWGHLYVCGK